MGNGEWDASWENWDAYTSGAVIVAVLIFGYALLVGSAHACALVGAM